MEINTAVGLHRIIYYYYYYHQLCAGWRIYFSFIVDFFILNFVTLRHFILFFVVGLHTFSAPVSSEAVAAQYAAHFETMWGCVFVSSPMYNKQIVGPSEHANFFKMSFLRSINFASDLFFCVECVCVQSHRCCRR